MQLVGISFETACIDFHCETCNGKGSVGALGCDPDWCDSCSGDGIVSVYLGTLFANLYAVGCAQLAINLGMQIGQRDGHDEWFAEYLDHVVGPVWRPGTNRPAPGWEGK